MFVNKYSTWNPRHSQKEVGNVHTKHKTRINILKPICEKVCDRKIFIVNKRNKNENKLANKMQRYF